MMDDIAKSLFKKKYLQMRKNMIPEKLFNDNIIFRTNKKVKNKTVRWICGIKWTDSINS